MEFALIFGIVILGIITLIALMFAIHTRGEVGKLADANATLKAVLEQAQKQAQLAADYAERVRELELANTRLEENLSAEKASLAKVDESLAAVNNRVSDFAMKAEENSKKIVSLTSENTQLKGTVDDLKDRLEESQSAEKALSAKVDGLNEQVQKTSHKNAALMEQLEASKNLLAKANNRVSDFETEAEENIKKIVSLTSENTQLKGTVDDLKDRLEERDDLETRFADNFKALSAEMLAQQGKNFIATADATLKEREKAIQKLVDPLEKRLGELDHAVANSSGALKQQIETLVKTNNEVSSETRSLSNALSRPQVRGQWGEMQVERALDLSGLQKGIHYTTQIPDEQGGRTDFIIHLPHKREIILDSKVSLSDYLKADAAPDDRQRDQHLRDHARSVKQHADSLARKEYWNSLPHTADFIVMVVPEFALPPAVERNPQILDRALSKNVVIATYSTLVALLKCVAMGWQERNIADEALKIGELGKDLHDRIATYTDHVLEVGKALDRAVTHYNQSVGSLESRVLSQARRFPKLGVQTTKELPEIKPVEVAVRALR